MVMKRIAIIPARSGSKGLKDKNIKELNGKPLIAYSIECANNSGMFDKVFVSTDSQKYADIAIRYAKCLWTVFRRTILICPAMAAAQNGLWLKPPFLLAKANIQ